MAGVPRGGAVREIHRLFAEGTMAGLRDGQLLERFLADGDEAAFAALVERHGPMVLGTCRAVLRNRDDAEDAFQATFLVLVVKAPSIRGHEALGGWLRQVAHRIAIQAGADAANRRRRQRLAGQFQYRVSHGDEPDEGWREILHQEVARLSDKYRLPVLLCDVEGKTHAQAALDLGCGEKTLRRRLARARELLRCRLARRGVGFTAAAFAAALERSAAAQVSATMVAATVQAAGAFTTRAAGIAIRQVVATTAATLARKSLRTMFLSKLKAVAAVVLLAVGGIAWGVGMPGQHKTAPDEPSRMRNSRVAPSPPPGQPKTERPADPGEIIGYRGRVLDPQGRPFSGARIYLVNPELKHAEDPPVRATSGPDGRFHFDVSKSDFDCYLEEAPWSYAPVLAQAPGFAFGVANEGPTRELTLRLARDDVPVSGRIVDLQGRPAAGVTVRVLSVRVPTDGTLDGWLKALEERKELYNLEHEFLPSSLWPQPDPPLIEPVRTGADGHFVVRGIGRERVAGLQIEGPAIETVQVEVRTRPGPTIRVPGYRGPGADRLLTIYGAAFEHVAGPTRPLEGVVRDLDTGRPIAGIMVHGERPLGNPAEYIQAMTDAQGRYLLVGLPQGREGAVLALPPCDFPDYGRRKAQLGAPPDETLPYLRAKVPVGRDRGTAPLHLDINLKRGVWVTGRVLDESTGKAVRAQVEYFVFVDNPHVNGYRAFRDARIHPHFAGSDGAFRLVAFPGPGVLAARADGAGYIRAAGLEKIKNKRENGLLYTYPLLGVPDNFNVLNPIDPAPGTASLTQDLLLESGRSLTLTVVGPDGRALTDLHAIGLRDMSYWEKAPYDRDRPGFTVTGLTPGRGRTVGFRHEAKRLIGELVLRGDESAPQTIILQPWGGLTGRVVDSDGQPVDEGKIYPIALPGGYPEIGKDGRFRVDGLVPGKVYDLQLLRGGVRITGFLAKGVQVAPSEVKDLGDLVPQSAGNGTP
jgi:RNA polymerase sigma factor (sigma-70 family)